MAKGKKKKKIGTVRLIIIVICAMVFCGSAAYLGLYVKEMLSAENEFKAIASEDKENRLESAFEKNNDVIAWVNIKGTKINYPVMHTPSSPEFYLYRGFNKEDSSSGTPFLDGDSRVGMGAGAYAETKKKNKVGDETWNWLVYGHNMKFGTMFHDLLDYEKADFYKEHRTFEFEVIENRDACIATGKKPEIDSSTWEVFAIVRAEILTVDSTEFKYYQNQGYSDKASFENYVENVCDQSIHDTGIRPEYGEQLLTLSTCAYHTDGGRFYIVARKVIE